MTRASATLRDEQLQQLAKYFSEEQIVELTLTVCVANFTNRVNDTLLCDPDLG